MTKKIIVCVGLPASGKTMHAKLLGKKLNIPLFETGSFVYEEVRKAGLEITPKNIKKVTLERKSSSDSFFTEKVVEAFEQQYPEKKAVFLSGIRALSEIDFLRSRYGDKNVVIIGFHASRNTRFSRVSNPDRKEGREDAKSKEDAILADYDVFKTRDEKELQFGVGSIFALSDYVCVTEDRLYPFQKFEQSLSSFESMVRELIKLDS